MEENKVLLILVDGMRSDSLDACGHPYVAALRRESVSTPRARSVVPPVTLPCHMSLFHSVPPARHGVTTNVYVPQVRPLEGLCDYLARFGRRCAMFYSWEQLRDLSRPASLSASLFLSGKDLGYGPATGPLVKSAMETMAQLAPDFVFLYLGEPDEVGHNEGWMSPAYLRSVRSAWDSIQQVLEQLPPSYTAPRHRRPRRPRPHPRGGLPGGHDHPPLPAGRPLRPRRGGGGRRLPSGHRPHGGRPAGPAAGKGVGGALPGIARRFSRIFSEKSKKAVDIRRESSYDNSNRES